MLCHEGIAAIFGGKLAAFVEDHAHRGRVRLDQYIGDGDLVL